MTLSIMRTSNQQMGSLKISMPSQGGFMIIEEGPSEDFFSDSSSTNVANPTDSGNAGDVKAPAIVH